MKKIHLNLSVYRDLIRKARENGLVISKFLENKLLEHFQFIDVVSKVKNNRVGPPRFELGLPAPQAGRMPSYPTGPKNWIIFLKSFIFLIWILYDKKPLLNFCFIIHP